MKKFSLTSAEDKKLKPIFGKGWSLMNILIGIVLIIAGFIAYVLNYILGFLAVGDADKIPIWVNVWDWVSLSLIILGAFGFWFVIPAFQKWGKTKPWLASIFLIIALVIALVCLILLKFI